MQNNQGNNPITFKIVDHGSEEYKEIIVLRQKILRTPLEMEYTQEQIDAETVYTHIGGYNESGKLVSCCFVDKDYYPDALKVRQVAVDDTCRYLGYGKKMMAEVLRIAGEMGKKAVCCNARDVARTFYEKCGFVVEGDSFEEVGIKHWYMVKAIE